MNFWATIALILYFLPVFDMLGDFDEMRDEIRFSMIRGELPWFPSIAKWIATIAILLWPFALMIKIILGVIDRD